MPILVDVFTTIFVLPLSTHIVGILSFAQHCSGSHGLNKRYFNHYSGGAMFSSVGRVQVTRHGNLEISSVQLLDAGTYICSWLDTESSETTTYRLTRLTVLGEQAVLLPDDQNYICLS